MKTFVETDYNNMLDYVPFTSGKVEETIRQFRLEFLDLRNQKVEWEIGLPSLIRPFYKYLYQKKTIITQQQFFDEYLNCHRHWFNERPFTPEDLEGIRARVYRTYPSLVRDLHFVYFASENLKNVSVMYNTDLDLQEGIDLMIIDRGSYHAVCLFTDTRRSNDARGKKGHRHSKFDNVDYIELPVNFSKSRQVGEFFLYGNRELDLIKEKIDYLEKP